MQRFWWSEHILLNCLHVWTLNKRMIIDTVDLLCVHCVCVCEDVLNGLVKHLFFFFAVSSILWFIFTSFLRAKKLL